MRFGQELLHIGIKKKYAKEKSAIAAITSFEQKNDQPDTQKKPQKYAAQFYQLKVRHRVVGTYLERIKIIKAPDYWWCREIVQLVKHLYAKCRK